MRLGSTRIRNADGGASGALNSMLCGGTLNDSTIGCYRAVLPIGCRGAELARGAAHHHDRAVPAGRQRRLRGARARHAAQRHSQTERDRGERARRGRRHRGEQGGGGSARRLYAADRRRQRDLDREVRHALGGALRQPARARGDWDYQRGADDHRRQATLPADNVGDLIRLARAQPGKLSYATSGVGTVLHLAMERVKARAGIDIVHVPYKGAAQIYGDLMGNQIDLAMLVTIATLPQVAAGKFKALGVTTPQRLASAPPIPTLATSPALKGFDMVAWTRLFAPAKTPAAIVERLNRELNDALASPEVGGKFEEQGAVLRRFSTAEFAAYLRKEQAEYGEIVRAAGIKEQ